VTNTPTLSNKIRTGFIREEEDTMSEEELQVTTRLQRPRRIKSSP